jgi:hypothetical protein
MPAYHTVVTYNKEEDVVVVIAAYEPDPDLGQENYTRRRS